jgi:uncharacterized protein (TIRG00374 family)
MYRHDRHTFVLFFGLTFANQFLMNLNIWVIAQALGIQLSLLYVAGVVPLVFLMARLPVSINGLGVYDGILMFFMSMVGIAEVEAIAITFVGRIMDIISWLPWWMAQVLGSVSTQSAMRKVPRRISS